MGIPVMVLSSFLIFLLFPLVDWMLGAQPSASLWLSASASISCWLKDLWWLSASRSKSILVPYRHIYQFLKEEKAQNREFWQDLGYQKPFSFSVLINISPNYMSLTVMNPVKTTHRNKNPHFHRHQKISSEFCINFLQAIHISVVQAGSI